MTDVPKGILLPDLEPEELKKLSAKGFIANRLIAEGMHSRIYLFYKTIETKDSEDDISKPLACKVADANKMPKSIFIKFFLRELDMLSKINHPNIIKIHCVLQISQKYFIFMRYAELGDLANYISKVGFIKEKQTRAWMRQLATALVYLHTLGIAHRDVKCDNILISSNMNLKLTDFGFSRVIINTKGKEVHSGTFCGSIGYTAPEVIRGTKYYPRVADVWCVGVVMFAMINGYLPFKSDNTARLYADQMSKNYTIRKDIVVSSAARDIIAMLLEPEPSKRLELDQLLRSRWMRSVPKYRLMTEDELDAMVSARMARNEFLSKNVKHIVQDLTDESDPEC